MEEYKQNRSSIRQNVVKCFWDSYIDIKDFSLKSEDDLMKALDSIVWRWLYRDFSPRTLTPKENGLSTEEFTEKSKAFLAKNFYTYFHNDALCVYKYDNLTLPIECNNFEKWHETMCNSMLELIQERYQDKKEHGTGYTNVEYGKAQKIVNMFFKYIYCFDDAEQYLGKFEPCHITIDSIIIDWFADIVAPELGYDSIKNSSAIKWSKSFIKGNADEQYTYLWYQAEIKNFLSKNYLDQNGKPLPSLIAEFYAWPEEQWLKASTDWIKLDLNRDNFPKYEKDDIFLDKKKQMKELLK